MGMLTKLVLVAVVAWALWALVVRPFVRPRIARPRAAPPPVALAACPDCGVFRDADRTCSCQGPR